MSPSDSCLVVLHTGLIWWPKGHMWGVNVERKCHRQRWDRSGMQTLIKIKCNTPISYEQSKRRIDTHKSLMVCNTTCNTADTIEGQMLAMWLRNSPLVLSSVI